MPREEDLDEVVFLIIGFPADPGMMVYNSYIGSYEESIVGEYIDYTINTAVWEGVTEAEASSYFGENSGLNVHVYVYGTSGMMMSLAIDDFTDPLMREFTVLCSLNNPTCLDFSVDVAAIRATNVNGMNSTRVWQGFKKNARVGQ